MGDGESPSVSYRRLSVRRLRRYVLFQRNGPARTTASFRATQAVAAPRGRAGRGARAGGEAQEDSSRVARDLRHVHAGHGGLYAPLGGFMGHDDWRSSCLDMKLVDGVFWPIPITLPVEKRLAEGIYAEGMSRLSMRRAARYSRSWRFARSAQSTSNLEAEHVYRTTDPKSPGVAKVLSQGEVNFAGPVMVLSEGEYPVKYPDSTSALSSRGPCSLSGAGRMSPLSRPEIPCTGATST